MHVEVFRYLFRYFWDSKFGKNVKTFGFDMILSVHVDNKKDILILFKRSNARVRQYYIGFR